MKALRSLGGRLFASHLAVMAASSATVLLVARAIAPRFYRGHLESMAQMMDGAMTSAMEQELESGFLDAFASALVVSVLIGILISVVLAIIGSRRVVTPINEVRRATRRLARGHYRERVAEPVEEELAALVEDVNHLADTLAFTEERRLRLLGEVAHELRTPLSTIEGYMEAVLDGVLEPTPDVIASVAHEASRLKRLAADISLLSSAEEASLTLNRRPMDLTRLTSDVVARLTPQFQESDVVLSFESEAPCRVVADPDRVTQIVTNLLGNALTYTPSPGSVTVGVHCSGAVVEVVISDTGVGIEPGDVERVFERFHRGDRSAPGGMGVGLTIARSLARLHGGDVTVESEGAGRGSSFTFSLPTGDTESSA